METAWYREFFDYWVPCTAEDAAFWSAMGWRVMLADERPLVVPGWEDLLTLNIP